MDTPKQNDAQTKTQICIIKVIFPVDSDENALGIKNGIDNLISGIEGSRADFSIKTMFGNPPLPAGFKPPQTDI